MTQPLPERPASWAPTPKSHWTKPRTAHRIAGNMAGRVSQGRSATVAVEGMHFLRPVKVGDEVTLYATLTGVGRTSMHVHVDVWARSRFGTEGAKVTEAEFVFVALDEDGSPRQIPND